MDMELHVAQPSGPEVRLEMMPPLFRSRFLSPFPPQFVLSFKPRHV
jgi:hypothetical protein